MGDLTRDGCTRCDGSCRIVQHQDGTEESFTVWSTRKVRTHVEHRPFNESHQRFVHVLDEPLALPDIIPCPNCAETTNG
jgi:hypothetical protein